MIMVGRHLETEISVCPRDALGSDVLLWEQEGCHIPSSLRLVEKHWFRQGKEPSVNLTVPHGCQGSQ